MIDFRTARVRSNPSFRLLPFDHCDEPERRTFAKLAEDPNFYGVLVPPSTSSAPVKSLSCDAALLFLSLREPACAPHLLASVFASHMQERMRELVLDGVFEIELGEGFVSGGAALRLLGDISSEPPDSRLAQLSADAISYVASLDAITTSEAAMRLYMYNRVPCTPILQRQFASDASILAYLTGETNVFRLLEKNWVRDAGQQAWLVWHNGEPAVHHRFKLFVSPVLQDLPHTFQVAMDAFLRVRCAHFKVGRTAFGLLRPDKFVGYFDTLEQVREAAELIRASSAGISAHGVPFTAAIDAEGLVSWGMDPPRFEQVMAWQEYQSWRQWVTERIAVYTLSARESGAESAADFARQRINLDGVDTSTWSPNLAIWRGSVATEDEPA